MAANKAPLHMVTWRCTRRCVGYREICGGCRTRAECYTGDLFESDPAFAYVPKVLREVKERNM